VRGALGRQEVDSPEIPEVNADDLATALGL